ncbi:MAG TPA: dienelactone hydrolase family protein [Anaeromyxobacter sp.]|nr:dienelactone hydrolase family protein [Anaeromyxobacter sp.]
MPSARLAAAIALALAAPAANAELVTRTIEYKQGGTVLEGYLAYDTAGPAKKPGVVIFHQWMGLTAYERMRAEQLAALGFVAFAGDIYGKGIRPTNPKEAAAEAGKYRSDIPLLRARTQAALAALRQQPNVLSDKVAAIGYCFGGGAALELARSGADLLGTVTFHGSLSTPRPEDARNIHGKVLVLHGADDPAVNRATVLAFEDEMKAAKVDWEVVLYSGTVHSFTQPMAGNDPSTGNAYNPESDRRSWQAMRDFFAEIFGTSA